MNFNNVNFPGNAMLPAAPFLSGMDKEFAHTIPLSRSPEEIHPQSVTFPIIEEEFVLDRSKLEMGAMYWSRNDHVLFGFEHHEMHGNNPSKPSVIVGFGFESVKKPGVIADHPVNPAKRIYG